MSFYAIGAPYVDTKYSITELNHFVDSTTFCIEEHNFFWKMQLPKERFQTFMPLRVFIRERINQYNSVNYTFKKSTEKSGLNV